MPLYLCQSGLGHVEPWRQGVPVYAAPAGDVIRRVRHAEVVLVDDICIAHDQYWVRLRWPGHKGGFAGYIKVEDVASVKPPPPPPRTSTSAISEEEDEEEEEDADMEENEDMDDSAHAGADGDPFAREATEPASEVVNVSSPGHVVVEAREEEEETDLMMHDVDVAGVGGGGVTPSSAEPAVDPSSSEEVAAPTTVSCLRTGLPFLSTQAVRLLPTYDDGLNPQVSVVTSTSGSIAAAPFATEPVFCRICREGMHDDADDEQPSPAAEDAEETANARGATSRQSSVNIDDDEDNDGMLLDTANVDFSAVDGSVTGGGGGGVAEQRLTKGPLLPHPKYSPNPHALENPLLAPCECSGSMAFVHYLCVEQWRCRSRHPDAQNGLACETCGAAYSLPPPASRPVVDQQQAAEDWLDAMPPHVMQALRNPHLLWQIGAAVVRRRWLRPLAPVFMSPIVALYCRARRLLKKRGVARRRWACSLCRRRARWKCVRCLRSYYCSRQCQNVSWHIVHKHVCYKPVRLWWSTVVYGALTLFLFPGITRDPLMYDLGLFLLPFSFVVIGILAGGIATAFKKSSLGLDLRGRMLELTVVLGTLWLTYISWGLVQGFFGQPSACQGSLGRSVTIADESDISSKSLVLYWLHKLMLVPAQSYYLMWDDLALKYSGSWLSNFLCQSNQERGGCFEFLPYADAGFIIGGDGGDIDSTDSSSGKCAADLLLVWYLYVAAIVAYFGSALYKYRERRQRRRMHHQHHRAPPLRQQHAPRPHQD